MKWNIMAATSLVAIFCMDAHAQTVLLSDTFESDISRWTQSSGAPTVTMEWDSGIGSPLPGSLRLATSTDPSDLVTIEAHSPCFLLTPDEMIQTEAMVLARSASDMCFIAPILYAGTNCTGERTFTANVPPNAINVWELDQRAIPTMLGFQSFRVGLAMTIFPGIGTASCHFDSVSVTTDGIGRLPEVPAFSKTGLLLLIITIGTLAIHLLRCEKTAL